MFDSPSRVVRLHTATVDGPLFTLNRLWWVRFPTVRAIYDLVAQLVEQPEEGMSLVRAQPWPVLVWMAHLKQHKWYSEFYAKILSATNFLIDVLRGLGEESWELR